MTLTPATNAKGKALPFAQQNAEWRTYHAAISVAGFTMCDEARGTTLTRAQLVAWYAAHLTDIDDVRPDVELAALDRLAAEDINPTAITAESFK
jgi:hypothetical protein